MNNHFEIILAEEVKALAVIWFKASASLVMVLEAVIGMVWFLPLQKVNLRLKEFAVLVYPLG